MIMRSSVGSWSGSGHDGNDWRRRDEGQELDGLGAQHAILRRVLDCLFDKVSDVVADVLVALEALLLDSYLLQRFSVLVFKPTEKSWHSLCKVFKLLKRGVALLLKLVELLVALLDLLVVLLDKLLGLLVTIDLLLPSSLLPVVGSRLELVASVV